MRVITGTARGMKLEAPYGLDVRPTSDKIKEAVFSAVQFDLDGANVLDLFAGSGQLGIEALSRGAKSAVFTDRSKKAVSTVIKNLEKTGFSAVSKVHFTDGLQYLRTHDEIFGIAFIDPPYGKNLIVPVLEALKLESGGKAVCEHEADVELPRAVGGLTLEKEYKYGNTRISVYRNIT